MIQKRIRILLRMVQNRIQTSNRKSDLAPSGSEPPSDFASNGSESPLDFSLDWFRTAFRVLLGVVQNRSPPFFFEWFRTAALLFSSNGSESHSRVCFEWFRTTTSMSRCFSSCFCHFSLFFRRQDSDVVAEVAGSHFRSAQVWCCGSLIATVHTRRPFRRCVVSEASLCSPLTANRSAFIWRKLSRAWCP